MKRCALFLLFRFAAGLFEGVELDGKALKEKPEKLAYLDKLLKYTEEVLGEQIPVRSAHGVSGRPRLAAIVKCAGCYIL